MWQLPRRMLSTFDHAPSQLRQHLSQLHSQQPYQLPSDLIAASAGLQLVTGVAVEHLGQLIQPKSENVIRRDLTTWRDVRRGVDIFIRGLGSFNAADVYNRVIGNALSPYFF